MGSPTKNWSKLLTHRSWARYLKIKTGNDNVVLMGNPETILKRLYAEIEKRNQHQFETG
jgi:hypothetical protein